MKVVHVLDCSIPNVSGYASRSKYIVEFQKRLGIAPCVLTSPRQKNVKAESEIIEGIRYYRTLNIEAVSDRFLSGFPLYKEYKQMRLLKNRLDQIVKKESPDIIHAHSPVLWGSVASSVARRYGIPFVYEVRALWEDAAVDQGKTKEGDLRYKLTRLIETDVLRKSDGIITICEGLKEEIIGRGISQDKVFVIPNGVDTEKFVSGAKNQDLERKLGVENKFVIGYIGSLYKFEGVEYLIKAMPAIIQKNIDAVLIIVGGGLEEDRLKDLADQLSLKGKVIFAGKVPHSEVNDYYNLTDILVYPRLKARITEMVTPIKPLEAMSMGKTILVSDVGGLKELVRKREAGTFFKAEDIGDLADKCSKLIGDSALRRKTGEQARIEMKELRNWDKIISAYENIYPSVLKRRGK